MARELVAIKVKIGLKGADWPIAKERGHHLYPNFNNLPSVIESGMDWSRYVDVYGIGWHYDKTCGHAQEEAGSPYGMRWGMLIVPKNFADQAKATFPEVVVAMDEGQCQCFWDEKAHAHEPEEKIDDTILKRIEFKQKANETLTEWEEKAIDPSNDTPGVMKNHRKYWVDFKNKLNIEIVEVA